MRPTQRDTPEREPYFSAETSRGPAWFLAPSPARGASLLLWARERVREQAARAGEQRESLAARREDLLSRVKVATETRDAEAMQAILAELDELTDAELRQQHLASAWSQAVIGRVIGELWHHPTLALEAVEGSIVAGKHVPARHKAHKVEGVEFNPQMTFGGTVFEELARAGFTVEDAARMQDACLDRCGAGQLLRARGVRAAIDFFGQNTASATSP